jgi:hypothetical protein
MSVCMVVSIHALVFYVVEQFVSKVVCRYMSTCKVFEGILKIKGKLIFL